MGSNAATKLYRVVLNTERVLAIELLNAAQALEFRRPLRSSKPIEDLLAAYRKHVPFVENDQVMYTLIDASVKFASNREIVMLLVKNIAKIVGVDESGRLRVKGRDMNVLGEIDNAWLLADGDRIAAYGTMDKMPEVAPDTEVVDAEGGMLFRFVLRFAYPSGLCRKPRTGVPGQDQRLELRRDRQAGRRHLEFRRPLARNFRGRALRAGDGTYPRDYRNGYGLRRDQERLRSYDRG